MPLSYRELIIKYTESGKTGIQLILDLMGVIGPTKIDREEYDAALEALIKEQEIIEIEYILPQMNYKIKSFYLPKGTKLNIRG